jgi:propionyl-CoA carboxylase alpha chain
VQKAMEFSGCEMNYFKSILISNRGEIARRIANTVKSMGIQAVGLYSDVDRQQVYLRSCDSALHLPGKSPKDTYLNIDLIIELAKKAGVDAIHPGYGFLSENPEFARACRDNGLTFIGPPPEAIEEMGSKIRAKELAAQLDVPTLRSIKADGDNLIESQFDALGYPLLIKASAGGGGRGMRIVNNFLQLKDEIISASREAKAAFGDPSIFVEKYLDNPRHIEIQIFADSHGNCVSLFERDCSIQRRYQKLIEETPAPYLDDETRDLMGQCAVKIAKAVNYLGAGTVEFVYKDKKFYFLEVNTRLQVEHPVTEEVLGLDLVRLQIEVAMGLSLDRRAISPEKKGHAIEVRLNAEDPKNDWMSSSGKIFKFYIPTLPGIRVDSGYEAGCEVPVEYDSLIAKVISHADTREEAARKLAHVLADSQIFGPKTNLSLLRAILLHSDFNEEPGTAFLVNHPPSELINNIQNEYVRQLAAGLSAICYDLSFSSPNYPKFPNSWRNVFSQPISATVVSDAQYHVKYRFDRYNNLIYLQTNDTVFENIDYLSIDGESIKIETNGCLYKFNYLLIKDTCYIQSIHGQFAFEILPKFKESGEYEVTGSLKSPLPGTVVKINFKEGEKINKGECLLAIEAMKMELSINSPTTGTVSSLNVKIGSQVSAGEILAVVDESGE